MSVFYCCKCEKKQTGEFKKVDTSNPQLVARKLAGNRMCLSCSFVDSVVDSSDEIMEQSDESSSSDDEGISITNTIFENRCNLAKVESVFKQIHVHSYEFTNSKDFDIISNAIPNTFYSFSNDWDPNRNLRKMFDSPVAETQFRIFDSSCPIVDKMVLYNFLTSKGCSINKDVNQWLADRLVDKIVADQQVKKIKAEIEKVERKQIYVKSLSCTRGGPFQPNAPPTKSINQINEKTTKKKKKRRNDRKKKQINVNKHFGLKCVECNGDTIEPRSSKRATTNLNELTSSSSRRENGDRLFLGISEILESNGQTMESFLDYIFEKDTDLLYRKVANYCSKDKNELTKLKHLISDEMFEESFNPVSAIYFTDKHLMSDHLFEEFVRFYHLKSIMLSVHDLKMARGDMNRDIIERYKIESTENSIHVDPELLLRDVLVMMDRHHYNIPDELEIKLFWDGRPGNEVIFSFMLLNTPLSTQCRDNVFITDMFKGKEDKKSVNLHFDKTFNYFDNLQSITFSSESSGSRTLKVKTFVCTDMAALWKMSDNKFVCPYCKCDKGTRMDIDYDNSMNEHISLVTVDHFQKYSNLFKNVVIDPLHAKLRILDCLLILQANKSTSERLRNMEKKMQQFPGLSHFQFREKVKNRTLKGETVKQIHEVELETPYINGDQADLIFLNFEAIFFDANHPEDFTSVDCQCWSLIRKIIFHYIEAPPSILKFDKDVKKKLQKELQFLQKALTAAYPNSQFAFYIHIILAHLPDMLESFGSLTKYMNQGCEAYHALGRLIKERKSNNKKNYNLPSFCESVLLPTRTVYVTSQKNQSWYGKIIEEDLMVSKLWIQALDFIEKDAAEALVYKTTNDEFGNAKRKRSYSFIQKNVWAGAKEIKEAKQASEQTQNLNTESQLEEPSTSFQPKVIRKNKIKSINKTQSACDRCKKQHIKCDEASPCKNCKKNGVECVRTENSNPKKKPGRKRKTATDVSSNKKSKASNSSQPNASLDNNVSTNSSQSNPRTPLSDSFVSEIDVFELENDFFADLFESDETPTQPSIEPLVDVSNDFDSFLQMFDVDS